MEFEYVIADGMPFKIRWPKGYEDWIREQLPAYIFYDRFKKVLHCTRCSHTQEYSQKITKGNLVTCPHCGNRLKALPHTTPAERAGKTFLHFWTTKKAIYYAEVWAVWDYRFKKDAIKDALCKDYSPTREQEEHTFIVPMSVGSISRDKQQAWERHWNYSGLHREGSWSMLELKKPRLVDIAGWWKLHPNTEKVLSKTFLGVDSFRNIKYGALLVKELALHAKYPSCEYVVKAGLGEYIDCTVEDWRRTYIRPNWKAKTLPGFLRIKAQDIDKLRKWERLDVEDIAYYKKILSHRKKPQLEELNLVRRWLDLGALYSGKIPGDPVKLARYFERQWLKGEYRYDDQMVYQYEDYIQMLGRLGYPRNDDYYRYPKSLKEAHDKAVAEYNRKQEEARKKEAEERRRQMLECERIFIEEILPKLQRYNTHDDKYIIRALESVDDIKAEGVNNHNCVGTYADRAMKGNAKIFVLRKVDAPEISFVTIELALDEKSVKQCYGRGNSLPDEEVKTWVDHWLKTVVNGKKKRRSKAA